MFIEYEIFFLNNVVENSMLKREGGWEGGVEGKKVVGGSLSDCRIFMNCGV